MIANLEYICELFLLFVKGRRDRVFEEECNMSSFLELATDCYNIYFVLLCFFLNWFSLFFFGLSLQQIGVDNELNRRQKELQKVSLVERNLKPNWESNYETHKPKV